MLLHPQPGKRPRTYYWGQPLSEICDWRLHRLSSPRRRCPESLRAGYRVEMGWRFVFGSTPEEIKRREEDQQRFDQEEARYY